MLGDILIFIKNWWKINISCRHKYVYKDNDTCTAYWKCVKCGRIRKYHNQYFPD